jgi:uncharacterized protein
MAGQSKLLGIIRIIGTPLRFILIGFVYLYRSVVSPVLPNSCIYTPSCSQYTLDALKKHGILGGGILAVTRISRCAGGLFTGGDDPVPERFSFHDIGVKYRKFRRKKGA